MVYDTSLKFMWHSVPSSLPYFMEIHVEEIFIEISLLVIVFGDKPLVHLINFFFYHLSLVIFKP